MSRPPCPACAASLDDVVDVIDLGCSLVQLLCPTCKAEITLEGARWVCFVPASHPHFDRLSLFAARDRRAAVRAEVLEELRHEGRIA